MPYVSVRDMFFLVHGPSKHRKAVAVFFGYFDGSNTHAGARIWTLCGFLGEEAAFAELQDEWIRILNLPCWPKRLSRFHMVDCAHGEGEFVGWSFAERLAIFGDLVSVILSCRLAALGSVVITEDFEQLEPEELALLRSEGLGQPLDLSIQYIFQRSISATRETTEDGELGILFDNENPEVRNRCLDFCDLYKKRFGFDKWLAGIGFGENVKFAPLQAADILAYCTYRYSMQRYPQIEPDFPVEPAFLRLITNIVNEGGGFDLESMKLLAQEIKKRHENRGILNNNDARAKSQTAQ